jgi:hypothetical protein
MSEPVSISKKLAAFIPHLLTAGILLLLLQRYGIESHSPLQALLPLLGIVFALNYWMPEKFRFLFLSLASVAGCFFILDPVNAAGLVLIMLSVTLFIGSKIEVRWKIIFSVLLFAVLVLARAGAIPVPFIPFAIPLAGSMLMFRLMLVLYEKKFTKPESTFTQNFSYFMLLPNLGLPLFPIVDYKTFLRNNSPDDKEAIQTGLRRMLMGILQLLIYRYIYMNVLPPLSGIHHATTAAVYLACSYLLILHLTGLMWIAVGYLGMLGFKLGPIFNNVFLVESFGDIWRRINIYWREFVMKVFYYPVYFRLRKKIKKPVLVSALIVFTLTGLMHGWQWFWLLGNITFHSTGLFYWSILGICISLSLARQEMRAGKTKKQRNGFSAALIKMLSIAGMFLFMSFMWSLWNNPTFNDWLFFLGHFTEGDPSEWFIISGFVLIVIAIGTLLVYFSKRITIIPGKTITIFSAWPSLIVTALLLFYFTTGNSSKLFPGIHDKVFATVISERLNSDDAEEATENYYDKMLATNGNGRRPWEMTVEAADPKSGFEAACVRRHDMLMREIIPSKTTDLGTWKIISNQWGMRDKDYAKEKTANTFRVALLGASYEMGSGVTQEKTFENVFEKMLNDSSKACQYEILNFAVGGYHPPQQVWVMENKVKEFHPDLALYFVHPEDRNRNDDYMANLVYHGYDLLYPALNATRNKAGARQGMSLSQLKNRFQPYNDSISDWSLQHILSSAQQQNARLVIVYLPSLLADEQVEADYYENFCRINKLEFVSMHGIFGTDVSPWKLATDETHPNEAANQLIAKFLFHHFYPIFRSYCTLTKF